MDLKKATGFEMQKATTVVPKPLGGVSGGTSRNPVGSGSVDTQFAETLNRIQKPEAKNVNANQTAPSLGLKFSNHAVERMRARGIHFSPEDLNRLQEAVGRAASKGSKDSLILMNDSALIVNVKSGTVVTVMDKSALKENVFTNIDSTVFM